MRDVHGTSSSDKNDYLVTLCFKKEKADRIRSLI